MIVKLLTEHHLEFLILKECCRGSSEPTLVKMSNCWKSHATAQISKSTSMAHSYVELPIDVASLSPPNRTSKVAYHETLTSL